MLGGVWGPFKLPRILPLSPALSDSKMNISRNSHTSEGQKSNFCFKLLNMKFERRVSLDFIGGPVVKNLPDNAGDMSSVPGPGKISHACPLGN